MVFIFHRYNAVESFLRIYAWFTLGITHTSSSPYFVTPKRYEFRRDRPCLFSVFSDCD